MKRIIFISSHKYSDFCDPKLKRLHQILYILHTGNAGHGEKREKLCIAGIGTTIQCQLGAIKKDA
jgi:hypothetical protein